MEGKKRILLIVISGVILILGIVLLLWMNVVQKEDTSIYNNTEKTIYDMLSK